MHRTHVGKNSGVVAQADQRWKDSQEELLRKARLDKFKGLRRKTGV